MGHQHNALTAHVKRSNALTSGNLLLAAESGELGSDKYGKDHRASQLVGG